MKTIGEEINTANCRKRRRIAKVKRKPVNGTWKIEKIKETSMHNASKQKKKCNQKFLKTMKPDETVKKNSKKKAIMPPMKEENSKPPMPMSSATIGTRKCLQVMYNSCSWSFTVDELKSS